LTEPELAYAAGFFDGEGHIAIHRNCRGQSVRYYVQCMVSQGTVDVLAVLAAHFGGNVRKAKSPSGPRWDWQITTAQAAAFLRAIRPYLIVKAAEADVALQLQSTMGACGPRTPPEVQAFRVECFNRIRAIREERKK